MAGNWFISVMVFEVSQLEQSKIGVKFAVGNVSELVSEEVYLMCVLLTNRIYLPVV